MMGLLTYLLRLLRTKSINATIAAEFEDWFDTVTSAGIQNLFLVTLREGNDVMTADVEPAELKYFDDIIAGFGATSDSQLHMPLIIQHLTRAYTTKAEVIQSASSILKTLILSHACFPFSSPVLLTKDAFCRAILLLTRRCEINFNQVEGTSSHDVIRERSKQKRLTFIYSALVRPPTGIPTHDDILDVVCRVRYPTGYYAKGVLRRRPISDFLPLAERLAPLEDKTLPDLLPASFLQPLKSIVEAFLPRQDKPVDDLGFDRRDTLSAEQFVLWATKVNLLEALDQLFSTFLCKI